MDITEFIEQADALGLDDSVEPKDNRETQRETAAFMPNSLEMESFDVVEETKDGDQVDAY